MTLACLVAAAAIVGPIVSGVFDVLGVRGVSNESWVEAVGLLGGTALALRAIDKRPWRDVWLDRSAARPDVLVTGFLVGAFSIALPMALLVAARWLAPERVASPSGGAGAWAAAGVRITLVLLPAALVEELLTRGYIFSVLRQAWGWKWSLAATSVVFGLLHLQNAGANVESTVLVILAGAFLAGVLVVTRSLYAAWMAHFAWNWMMAAVFHTAVSGYPMDAPGYRYVDAGPDWATGGTWGPEGGIPAALGMAAGLGFLIKRESKKSAVHAAAASTESRHHE